MTREITFYALWPKGLYQLQKGMAMSRGIRRRVQTLAKQCRECKRSYLPTIGDMVHDAWCCSKECYIQKPRIIKVSKAVLPPIPKVPRTKKHKRAKLPQKSREGKSFYSSDAWLNLRYQVLKKYGASCMCCGSTVGGMHVDHIEPRSKRPDLALRFDNLQVLCSDCNMGKLNRDNTDFRTTRNKPIVDTAVEAVEEKKE